MSTRSNDTPERINKKEDRSLQAFFSSLRLQDQKETPQFAHLWERAACEAQSRKSSPRPHPGFGMRFRFAAAAVVVISVVISAFFLFQQYQNDQNRMLMSKAESLTLWESPTATLLSYEEEGAETTTIAEDEASSFSVWEAPSDSLLDAFTNGSSSNG